MDSVYVGCLYILLC